MNKHIHFRTALLLSVVLFLGFGCSKKDNNAAVTKTTITGVDNAPAQYASLIQGAGLIKTLKTNTTTNPYPGLEVTNITYTSNLDVPMAVFLMKVDLSNPDISMEAATPNNGVSYGFQTVRNMITAKNTSSTSKMVIAGTNGDYFDTSTGEPLGVVFKNANIIKTLPAKYYYLSILKDKRCLIGDNTTYTSFLFDFKEALGARYLLLKDRELTTAGLDANIEPRTAVGVINDKKLVFVIVDGRRTGYSAGLSLADMGNMFKAIGVKDAVNLDGGGSTTLVLRNSTSGNYEVQNQPSDNAERAVGNAWVVMKTK